MSVDDFSNFPQTLGQIRASKAKNGALWTPKEALLDALGQIDRGEIDPSDLIIVARCKGEKSGDINLFNSSQDGVIACGMLARAMRYFSK